jgi:hypothetical protein
MLIVTVIMATTAINLLVGFLPLGHTNMRRSRNLIIFIIAISTAMVVVRNLRIAGYVSLDTQLVAAFVVFGLNVMAAIAGFWTTRFRVAWISYLVLTVVCMLLLSSSPLDSAWIMVKLAARQIFA